jgi:hypothetical protein
VKILVVHAFFLPIIQRQLIFFPRNQKQTIFFSKILKHFFFTLSLLEKKIRVEGIKCGLVKIRICKDDIFQFIYGDLSIQLAHFNHKHHGHRYGAPVGT